MPKIREGKLEFVFPDDWLASKFDDWSFYRNQYMKLADAESICLKCGERLVCAACAAKRVTGTKGIDILAIDGTRTSWQIEIKDYRQTRVSNFLFLADEVAGKVRDTLSALVAARQNAADGDEKKHATAALACRTIRVVLHLEQPIPHSPLHSPKTHQAVVQQRLRQLLKGVDRRAAVVSMAVGEAVTWNVKQFVEPKT